MPHFSLAIVNHPGMLVAFGMIGTSISGVTFISIPGEVGATAFSYMQLVLGYFLGYMVIANVLMPLYYRMNLSSIYVYLQRRLGIHSYKTGAFYFLVSRVIGSAFRLYLVAMVIDSYILSAFGVPFWLTVFITIALIFVYSFKGGIKTIIYTDTFQTVFLVLGVVLSIVLISKEMNLSLADMVQKVHESRYSDMFIWDWRPRNNFFKHFLSGMFICIVMTGLDQDMMQKNISVQKHWRSEEKHVLDEFHADLCQYAFSFPGCSSVFICAFKGRYCRKLHQSGCGTGLPDFSAKSLIGYPSPAVQLTSCSLSLYLITFRLRRICFHTWSVGCSICKR